jgi:hypothetical protein
VTSAAARQPLRPLHVLVGVAWLVLVLTGSGLLWRYKATPGTPGSPPATWPSESRIAPSPDLPTLVMFAHPMCPCTRASLDELEVLVSGAQASVRAYVLFVKPDDVGDDYDVTNYWARVEQIPGVVPRIDEGGREADRFGSVTSGHVLLYSPGGRLLYSGGITGARGHAGDNQGRRALIALLRHGAPRSERQPVFGCSLEDPQPPGEEAVR